MEHRCGTRKLIDIDVTISHPSQGQVHGRVRDVSMTGLRVEARLTGLPAHAHVELVFVEQDQGVARLHRVPAVVTRCTRDSVGLMFHEFNPAILRALPSFTRGHQRDRAVTPSPAVALAPPKRRARAPQPSAGAGFLRRLMRGWSRHRSGPDPTVVHFPEAPASAAEAGDTPAATGNLPDQGSVR